MGIWAKTSIAPAVDLCFDFDYRVIGGVANVDNFNPQRNIVHRMTTMDTKTHQEAEQGLAHARRATKSKKPAQYGLSGLLRNN